MAALPLLAAFLLSPNRRVCFLAPPSLSLSPPVILIKRHVSEVPPPPTTPVLQRSAAGMKGAHLPRSRGLSSRTGPEVRRKTGASSRTLATWRREPVFNESKNALIQNWRLGDRLSAGRLSSGVSVAVVTVGGRRRVRRGTKRRDA